MEVCVWRLCQTSDVMYVYVLLKIHITIIISREINWLGHVECIREARITYVLLVGNPERNKNLGNTYV
jgi:hypothetical protein